MKDLTIKKLADDLANELAERRQWDLENIKSLIYVKFRSTLLDMINDQHTFEEKQYLIALDQQSKNRIGSTEYIKLGYTLSALKAKKAHTNRLANNVKREDSLTKLKAYVTEKWGIEELNQLLAETGT